MKIFLLLLILYTSFNAFGQTVNERPWVFCAYENERCVFSGTKDVLYGLLGDFPQAHGTFTDGVDCNNATFGDPIPGTGKQCYYDDLLPNDPLPPPPISPTNPTGISATLVPGTDQTWTDGVNTWAGNPFCNITGSILLPTSPAIDYGVIIEGFHCPLPGSSVNQPKIMLPTGSPDAWLQSNCIEWYGKAPDAGACEFVTTIVQPSVWTRCAEENQLCIFPGTKEVRYGENNMYNYLTATNSIMCDNATFGDPIFGIGKHCDYKDVINQIIPSAPSNFTIK
jgi:hypothetical protein